MPPAEIRRLRDYTRLRTDMTRERTRQWQRLEKLLVDALITITTVASRIDTMPVRDMIEALIAGQRDPAKLADLADGRMKAKRAALIEALTGRFSSCVLDPLSCRRPAAPHPAAPPTSADP